MEKENGFDFQKFINDSRDVLLNPKDFFTRIKLDGGIGEPLLRAVIYGAIAGLFAMIWSFMNIGGALGGMFGGAAGIGAFFGTIIAAIIGAFIMGVIVLIISSICGGNTDYEANFRVAVAIMVVYPISSFLNILGGLSFWLNSLVSIALNLYILYVLFFGLTIALKGKEQSAKTVGYVLGGILILFMLIGGVANRATRKISKYGLNRMEESLKELEKTAKEIEKEAAAHYGELEEEIEAMEEKVEDFDDMQNVAETDPLEKPESFPQDAVEYANEWFSQTESEFSAETIDNVLALIEEAQQYDEDNQEKMLEILNSHGYNNITEFQVDVNKLIYSTAAVKALESLQVLIDATDEEQKAAEVFTFDQAIEGAVKQSIQGGSLTPNDIRVAYDNWEKYIKFNELTKEK